MHSVNRSAVTLSITACGLTLTGILGVHQTHEMDHFGPSHRFGGPVGIYTWPLKPSPEVGIYTYLGRPVETLPGISRSGYGFHNAQPQ
jgi:hypothetical protein